MIRKQSSHRPRVTGHRPSSAGVSSGSASTHLSPLTPPIPLAPNSFVSVRKIYLRKITRHFAKFSPFNSFRISKSISETSKKAVKLRAKYASQPIWNQHALSTNATCAFSLVCSLMHVSQSAIHALPHPPISDHSPNHQLRLP